MPLDVAMGRSFSHQSDAGLIPPLVPAPARFWLVAFLMAAYTAGYAWSVPTADTADELLRAYEIRHAIAHPLEGPFLGGAVHFGPIWFYLTALPLWIVHDWLAVALFVGFLCSLKFPLAYLCGRRLIDADFGVLWAVAMFVPGWTSLEQLVFLNPNLVAAATLAVVALTLRALDEPVGWPTFALLGLALAFAIHVHPTSAPVAALIAAVLWIRHRRGQRLLIPSIALAGGFVLLFVPYVISQLRGGLADLGSAGAYLSGQTSLKNIVNTPSVIANDLFTGPAIVAEYLMQWPSATARALGVASALAAALALAACFHARARPRLAQFAAALLVFAAWVACMRPTTPLQFTWILGPAVAALVALGLWSLDRMARLRPLVLALAAGSVALNLYAIRAIALQVWEGEGHLPSRIMDIKGRLPRIVFRDVWFPALSHRGLGETLCAAGPVSLHGHLAYIADKDLGLDALFVCNDRSRLSLLGSDGPAHYLGMTRPFWRALHAAPECWSGSLGLTRRMTPLLDLKPLALADGATYMPRQVHRNPPAIANLSVVAPRDAGVMVTNVLGGYEYFRIASASIGGRAIAPLAENDFSALFKAAPDGAASMQWTFAVETTNPQAIDVVAVEDARGGLAVKEPALCAR